MSKPEASDLVKLLLERRDSLLGFILALTRDRAAAEEVFQEVGLAVVEEAGRGTRVAKFLPWVHEMARRRVAEYFRKNSRRAAFARLDSLDEIVGVAFEENEAGVDVRLRRQDCLTECLDELPATQREMVDRRYREQASIQDIARSLDWTDGAVKVALWKARRRLEGCVENKMGEGE
ncbi:MAG TPA: sigma-70 family RNA polymerase sigma factor [Planctomycetota bacterium]